MKELNESGGGVLQKKVPLPKNMNEEADKRVIASLDDRQRQLKDIYDKLSKTKDGNSLVEHVKNGSIKVDERDKLGRCPLLVAIDTDMKFDVIKQLVEELNCDPKSADASGDTTLHYAVNMSRDDVADYLVDKCGDALKEMKNDDGETAYD